MYTLLDGRKLAARLRQDSAGKTAQLIRSGKTPKLGIVRVGDDPASAVYVGIKQKICTQVGIDTVVFELPHQTSEDEVHECITALNNDPGVHAVLLQLPLPKHLDSDICVNFIAAHKDVDGLTTVNAHKLAAGVPNIIPCTPLGVMNLLAAYAITPRGKIVAIIGRSNLVGTPLRYLMEHAGATVRVIHSHTQNPHVITHTADIVVAAAGVPHLVTDDWIKPGAVVVDVGITRCGKELVGDVDFQTVSQKCAYISPVPGGVGPMTVQTLLQNTLKLHSINS